MYKIDVDRDRNLIHIELSGFMQQNEIEQFFIRFEEVIAQFNKNEALILASLERLDPISQDNLNILIKNLASLSVYMKKIASIHKRTITRMQQERVVQAVNVIIGSDLPAKSFWFKKEAINYLFEDA